MINSIKTIVYMGIMHGLFTIYFPYQLASRTSYREFGVLRFLAFPFWIIGMLIIVQCSIDIIRRGRGTPAHFDPPKELVIRGLYRYVRNPIYVGALMVLGGFVIWFGSVMTALYSAFMFSAFHVLVLIEEAILRNTFGAAYEEYCRRVPRWIPRFR